MSTVSMVSACARQVCVINATMPVNRMRSASKENVFAKSNVPKVEHLFLLIILAHRSPCFLVFCPFPCLNGGRCTGFYQCTCRQGWQGHRCERRQDRSIALWVHRQMSFSQCSSWVELEDTRPCMTRMTHWCLCVCVSHGSKKTSQKSTFLRWNQRNVFSTRSHVYMGLKMLKWRVVNPFLVSDAFAHVWLPWNLPKLKGSILSGNHHIVSSVVVWNEERVKFLFLPCWTDGLCWTRMSEWHQVQIWSNQKKKNLADMQGMHFSWI